MPYARFLQSRTFVRGERDQAIHGIGEGIRIQQRKRHGPHRCIFPGPGILGATKTVASFR